MDNRLNRFEDITQEQLETWKLQHKDVEAIDVPVDDASELPIGETNAGFVICQPSRDIMFAAASYGDKESAKASRLLIKNCVLGGDMHYLEEGVDEDVFMAVLEAIGKKIAKKKATRSRRLLKSAKK